MREMGMPAEYINKLYRMLQDIELSKDINNSFKKGIGKNKSERNDLIESVSLKVLNAGAWSRFGEKVQLQLPRELEDILPEVDEFYRKQHNGRKLQWFHHWSYGTVSFSNNVGKFDLDVTTLQLSVLFCWNDRPHDQLSFETLRIATQLAKADLSRTLSWLVAFPKMKHQILLTDCKSMNFRDFTDSTLFWLNQQFAIYKNGKDHSRGRINLIGRLQLSMEQNSQDEHDDILQLRAERIQEAIVKIMKVRKRCPSAQLQTELIELVKNVFLPSKRLFKEQIEWLIENKYIERDPNDFNVFLYVS
ncbi:unnamed protein product [Dracunculus medinensis]|uniref:CULLIN_2 domain-containing protein n=1 Tax=Dracunculus medinensis TaxID=318479 RepID=A0A0N4UH99_DRAME|nr:unnamed protein product [Dracunculus medinensis]